MASAFALFAAKRPSIGPIVTNCTLSEVHGASYEISTSPVENGTTLTDNVIRRPIMLSMEAIFSPYPDNIIDQFRDADSVDTRATWARIRALADSLEPFEVYTQLQVYKNMMFVEFSHTEQDEGIIRLQATLQQIQIAGVSNDSYIAESVMDKMLKSTDAGLRNLILL